MRGPGGSKGSAVTGYGEDLIKNAFSCDLGLVETVAHLNAARHFTPEVDFIIDIGGQDMKCFKIRNGAVDSIMLNEACSSGCGSFHRDLRQGPGIQHRRLLQNGPLAQHPVNLGSRCTVFMNSSVKQAQKDGASVEDISAGLSISVVRNAIYKVIRAANADDLGQHIVVQGAPSSTTRSSAPSSRRWGGRSPAPPSPASWGPTEPPWPPRRPGWSARPPLSPGGPGHLHPRGQACHLQAVHQPLLPDHQPL